MKRWTLVLCIVLGLAVPGCATLRGRARPAPAGPPPEGYVIRGTKVTFVFDPAHYDSVTADSSGERAPLAGLRIRSVNVAGTFNGWSRSAWLMTRTDAGEGARYTLAHTLAEVGTGREYPFRFLVNDRWWVEPTERAWNRRPAEDGRAGYDLLLKLE